MESITLDDFRTWNDQLAALVQAGVPLDIGLDVSDREFAETLKTINATVARRVNRGESLVQALEDDDRAVPSTYRSLVQLGLRSGDLNAGLDGSTRIAESADTAQDHAPLRIHLSVHSLRLRFCRRRRILPLFCPRRLPAFTAVFACRPAPVCKSSKRCEVRSLLDSHPAFGPAPMALPPLVRWPASRILGQSRTGELALHRREDSLLRRYQVSRRVARRTP